ncbi:hypothetical protein NH8B_1859 [Pseudogulbenkiania sp. NH8B]|uniref:hypothetical protein n=1 Tax=Pseudogulbenkiania sp. (strain NH8B) TaxID=748280 RepID=UPI0002279EE4|nr:hypothetical protein [Pseudogulbenkiania sp. NH8B]BAK76675.1 hypothetical protein NH8B_1859 [Pseudogulbenkiania sp. NH8B]
MTATTADPAEIQVPKKPTACPKNHLKIAESVFANWFLGIPRGTTREQVLMPDFHAVVSDQYHAYDRITAVAEDRSFMMELMVMDSGRGWAHVIELSYHRLPVLLALGDSLPSGFEIEYRGVDNGYCAIRLCDNVVIASGCSSRAEAVQRLLDHSTLRN